MHTATILLTALSLAGLALAQREEIICRDDIERNPQYPPNWKFESYGPGENYKKFCRDSIIPFTSVWHVVASPGEVVDSANSPTGGLEGAIGYYDIGLNSRLNMICWNIRLENFRGTYQSPASTATHIHASVRGRSGPPRISFPNPVPVNGTNEAVSVGCMTGPFKTGLNGTDGQDTGTGFTVAMIEANPSGFNADVHSSLAVPGAVRGQLA